LNQDKLYYSLKKLELARNYSPALRDDPLYKEQVNNLCSALMKRAEKLGEKEMWGNALAWLQKLETLNPNYPDLFQKMNDVKDPLPNASGSQLQFLILVRPAAKRCRENSREQMIAYLHKNASVDLRIIERENLQSILRKCS